MKKNYLKKIVLHLLDKIRKFCMNGTGHLELFSHPQVIQILGNICFYEPIFYRTKQSLSACAPDSIFLKVNLNINCCPSYLGQ